MIIGIQAVLTKLKAFIDNFNRADNANTLAGSSGASTKWINYRGTWGISGNKANTATAAGSYPMAAIKTGAKTARAKITNGTANRFGYGVSFWVTDANNWYGLYSDRTYQQTSSTGQVSLCPSPYQNYGCGVCAPNVCAQCQPAPTSCSGLDPNHSLQQCGCGGAITFFAGPVGGANSVCNAPAFIASINFNGNGMVECGQCCTAAVPQQLFTVTTFFDNFYHYATLMKMNSGAVTVLNNHLFAHTSSGSNNVTFLQVETNTTSANSVRTSASLDGASAATAVVAVSTPQQTGTHGIFIAPRSGGTNASTQATNVDDFDYTPL